MNPKFGKRLSALLLSAAVAAGSVVSAGACCGLYIGSDETVTGSTYVGRSEDIGKLYDKVFEVIPEADHAAGAMYEDSYGFSMPYPAHTYRYTVMRDSVNRGETMTDANGNIIEIAYGEVGMNEKGVDKATGKVLIEVSPDFYRPTDVVNLWGDPTKARQELGWNPTKTSFEELVKIMVEHDMEKVAVERAEENIRCNLEEYLEKGVVK